MADIKISMNINIIKNDQSSKKLIIKQKSLRYITESDKTSYFKVNAKASSNQQIIVKFLVFSIAILSFVFYRIFYNKNTNINWTYKYCFKDVILSQLLNNVTIIFSQHLIIRDYIIIFASSVLDLYYILFLIIYVVKGDSWKHIIALISFYLFRGTLIQSINVMEFYDMYIWGYPAFPSLTVNTERTADFFYSGHTGIAFMLALIFRDYQYKLFYYFGLFLTLLQMFTMTTTRAHYSIDVIFGLIASHYFYMFGRKLGGYLDKKAPIFCDVPPVPEVDTIKYDKIQKDDSPKSNVSIDEKLSNSINKSEIEFLENKIVVEEHIIT